MRVYKKLSMRAGLLATTASLFALPSVSYAQSGDQASDVNDQIVVTATRREQSLQEVGLSITAISGGDLQARGAVDFEDFAISVPNLAFGATDDGVLSNRTITLRGIEGLNTTSIYIDDVPLDESVSPLVLDVERVEVLRGPQGTLFGARGLGGTVRIITKQPDFDGYSSRIHAGVSSTKEGGINYIVDGAVNFTVSDSLAVRLLGYYQSESGIFDRVIGPIINPGLGVPAGTPGALIGDAPQLIENVDSKEIYGGQITVRWQPTDNFDATTKVLAQRTEVNGFPLADFAFDAANPPAPFILSADDFTQDRLFNVDEGGIDRWIQASFAANYKANYGTFTATTGYFERNTQEVEDTSEFISFTLLRDLVGVNPVALPSPIFQELDFRTVVAEGRFVSDFESRFQMAAGIFYQHTDDDEAFNPPNFAPGFDAAFSPQVTGGALATGATGVGDLIFQSNTGFEVKELGIFGEFTYNITDRLSATFGARYFDTQTEFEDLQSGFAVGGFNAVNIAPVTQSEDGVNLKGLVQFAATDDLNLYASVTEGFRIGGANGVLPSALGCDAELAALGIASADAVTFDSDDLLTYEVGAKASLANGRVTVNAAGFYNDQNNIQQRVLLGCGFDFVGNAGAARTVGFELESTIQPTDDLLVQFGVGYTDAQFTETVGVLVSDGDRLQQVPELTVSTTIDYARPISNQLDGFIRGDFSHVGNSISRVIDSANPRVRPSYQILNGRIGIRHDNYELSFFVNNIFDSDAVFSDSRTLAAEATGRPRIVRNRPRAFGIDVRAKF